MGNCLQQDLRADALISRISQIEGYEDVVEDEPTVALIQYMCSLCVDDNLEASSGFCCPYMDSDGLIVAVTDAEGRARAVLCWACGADGHMARDCPSRPADGTLPFRPKTIKPNPFVKAGKGGGKGGGKPIAGAFGNGPRRG